MKIKGKIMGTILIFTSRHSRASGHLNYRLRGNDWLFITSVFSTAFMPELELIKQVF